MTDIALAFLDKSRHLLRSDYLPKIEKCLEQLNDDDLWWRPNDISNSIANLMLHLSGNLRQWIVGGVGQRAFERHRQQEFDERSLLSRAELLARLTATLGEVDDVLAGVNAEDLLTRRQIQDFDGTIMEAIYHVVNILGCTPGKSSR